MCISIALQSPLSTGPPWFANKDTILLDNLSRYTQAHQALEIGTTETSDYENIIFPSSLYSLSNGLRAFCNALHQLRAPLYSPRIDATLSKSKPQGIQQNTTSPSRILSASSKSTPRFNNPYRCTPPTHTNNPPSACTSSLLPFQTSFYPSSPVPLARSHASHQIPFLSFALFLPSSFQTSS